MVNYCTAIFNSALGVTCDLSAELYHSADLVVTCDTPQNFGRVRLVAYLGIYVSPSAIPACRGCNTLILLF
jgi:hypothetical protein